MPKWLIYDAFTLLINEKDAANYAILQRKTFGLKIWLFKILDKYHVWSWLYGWKLKFKSERLNDSWVHASKQANKWQLSSKVRHHLAGTDRKQFGAVKDSFAASLHKCARLQCRIVYFNSELVLLLLVISMFSKFWTSSRKLPKKKWIGLCTI